LGGEEFYEIKIILMGILIDFVILYGKWKEKIICCITDGLDIHRLMNIAYFVLYETGTEKCGPLSSAS
jgi:hypothetical protein